MRNVEHSFRFLPILFLLCFSCYNSQAFIQSTWRSEGWFRKIWSSNRERFPNRISVLDGHASDRLTNPPGAGSRRTASTSGDHALEDLTAERKASLFQFLLRDLQVEGVPLLAVDVDHPSNFQAAMWTTMSELADQPAPQKACLILEDMSVPDLQNFVSAYEQMRSDENLVSHVPELRRLNLSLLGKGVGPAIVMETLPASERTNATCDAAENAAATVHAPSLSFQEYRLVAASKMFVDRMLVGLHTHPALGRPGHVTQYRTCAFADAFHALSTAWTAVCELQQQAVPGTDEHSSTMVLWPLVEAAADGGMDPSAHQRRFAGVTQVLNRSLRLYGTDRLLDVSFFSPSYDWRCVDAALPDDGAHKSSKRHLGPMASLETTPLPTDWEDLRNYERRSPVPAILLQPRAAASFEATTPRPNDNVVDDDDDRAQEVRDGLVRTGREELERALRAEMDVAWASSQ